MNSIPFFLLSMLCALGFKYMIYYNTEYTLKENIYLIFNKQFFKELTLFVLGAGIVIFLSIGLAILIKVL